DVRRKLIDGKLKLTKPRPFSLRGTFYPAALMYQGWWERQAKVPTIAWRYPLQNWLFSGFHLWAPSIELTLEAADRCLIGQLGVNDEAESIPVCISPEKAKAVRQMLRLDLRIPNESQLVFDATVTGLLCPRDEVIRKKPKLRPYIEGFKWALLVSDDDPAHSIAPIPGQRSQYSGYLWKCMTPGSTYQEGTPPPLSDVFFVWEHTDLSDKDTRRFGLDSLESKCRLVASLPEVGDLALIAKSHPFVDPGKMPLLKGSDFWNFLSQE
ncbi:MAG TPA: hypothetical protein VN648_21625, partial [Candidatus Methylomirabilis sp.]|nr:hypothetical protein [Candidatus Methylomirabilis sp.]